MMCIKTNKSIKRRRSYLKKQIEVKNINLHHSNQSKRFNLFKQCWEVNCLTIFWYNWFRYEGEEIREEGGVDVEDEDDEEDY